MKTIAKGFHNDCPHNRNILWGKWAVAYMPVDWKDGDMPYRQGISLIGIETLIFCEPVLPSELSDTDVLLR